MVRGADNGGGVKLSSIALLQERFRQLQKMRELREKKQLLSRMSSEPERSYTPPIIIPTSKPWFSGSYGQTPQYCQLSLSLWPYNSENKNAGSPAVEAPTSSPSKISLFGSDRTGLACTSPVKLQSCDSEIDTSLRL